MRETCVSAEILQLVLLKYPSLRLKFCDVARFTGSNDTLAVQVALEYLAPTQVFLIKSAPASQKNPPDKRKLAP